MRRLLAVIGVALAAGALADCKRSEAPHIKAAVRVSDPAAVCASPETVLVLKSLFFDVGPDYSEASDPAYAAVVKAAVIGLDQPILDSFDGRVGAAQCSGVAVYRNGRDEAGLAPRQAVTFTVRPGVDNGQPVYRLIEPSDDDAALAFARAALAESRAGSDEAAR